MGTDEYIQDREAAEEQLLTAIENDTAEYAIPWRDLTAIWQVGLTIYLANRETER